jgi:glycosyltransferase involved in cell wall biosynthesis
MTVDRGGPRVSVVMPVFNGERYLRECLDSVLAQTFADFEVVVVEDGSTDGSAALLTEYASRDERVRVLLHEVNQGHHRTSNDAIAEARGEYLARMDQDDVWLPRRLEASVSYLDAHPEVGLLATSYFRLLPDGRRLVRHPPPSHTKTRSWLVFGNVICHPSVTLRRSLIDSGDLHYNDLPGPQDYDLWVRLLGHTRASTLPEPLVLYRENPHSMSDIFRDDLPRAAEDISNRQLRELLGSEVDGDTLRGVRRLVSQGGPREPAEYAHAHLVFDVFDALAARPDLARDELRSMRRKWCRRALTTAMRNRQTRAARPLVRQIARRDPLVLVPWLGRDVPSLGLSALRHRAGRPGELAPAE